MTNALSLNCVRNIDALQNVLYGNQRRFCQEWLAMFHSRPYDEIAQMFPFYISRLGRIFMVFGENGVLPPETVAQFAANLPTPTLAAILFELDARLRLDLHTRLAQPPTGAFRKTEEPAPPRACTDSRRRRFMANAHLWLREFLGQSPPELAAMIDLLIRYANTLWIQTIDGGMMGVYFNTEHFIRRNARMSLTDLRRRCGDEFQIAHGLCFFHQVYPMVGLPTILRHVLRTHQSHGLASP